MSAAKALVSSASQKRQMKQAVVVGPPLWSYQRQDLGGWPWGVVGVLGIGSSPLYFSGLLKQAADAGHWSKRDAG